MFVVGAWLRLRSVDEATSGAAALTTADAVTADATPAAAPAGEAGAPADDTHSPYPENAAAAQRANESLSARDRRYRELLNAPPPPAPQRTASAEEAPSMLDRLIAPVANALGVPRPRPTPPPVATPPSRPIGPAPNARERPQAETAEQTSTGLEQDPETDLLPPQLLSAEFVPPQVQDEEETVFIATITDNISGVRSASGVIASPSGSVQGFSAVREGEGNRFIARVKVPRDAPEGVWMVKYITLTDNAANSTHLNQAQGAVPSTAAFRVVSSSSDASGPQLKSVYLEKRAMRAGERNTVFVQAEDDKAGVSLVSGLFVSPARAARIGFGCRAGAGGTWECPLSAPSCIDCGIWKLEQIQLQDKAGNLATFRPDHAAVGGVVVDIAGDQCDGVAPVITMLTIDPAVVSNAQPNTVQVRATVHDDGPCGVLSLSGQAVPPGGVGGQRHPIMFKPSGDGTFLGTLNVQQAAVRGQWSISWMQVLDRGNNLRAYSSNDPAIARGTFRVE